MDIFGSKLRKLKVHHYFSLYHSITEKLKHHLASTFNPPNSIEYFPFAHDSVKLCFEWSKKIKL